MNDRTSQLEVKSIEHANVYFGKMKELYKEKMQEYVSELTYIS